MAGYGDDIAFSAWLTDNGLTLPVGAPTAAVLRNRGSDYVDAAYAASLTCSQPTGGAAQERAWPRIGHPFVPDDVIPAAWVRASYRAGYLIATNPAIFDATINPNARVTKEKVDVIEVAYADNGAVTPGGANGILDAGIDGLVAPFLCKTVYEIGIMVV